MAEIEKTRYKDYGHVVRLSNGEVELMATTDLGPRVIYYGFVGGENILGEMGLDEGVETELGKWRLYGGHRLWTAPEASPRSYAPDNDPVEFETFEPCGVCLRPPEEEGVGVRKEITVTLDTSGTRVQVHHKVTNTGFWPIELACWGLTIMRGGGTTIFPQEPFAPHTECLLPVRPLVLWSYTDMGDPRWSFGSRYVRLRGDAALDTPQKIGALVKSGWAAYNVDDILFVKRFGYEEGAVYPDFGCNFETYTRGSFMEVETLGPLTRLEPGECATHVERWHLAKGIHIDDPEAALEAACLGAD